MPAGPNDYDGVPYEEMVFELVDWSEAGDHHPRRRSQRKPGEVDIEEEWADEAVADPRRVVGSAGSRSGATVKVVGYSASAGFLVTAIVAPKASPSGWQWWGATAWKSSSQEAGKYGKGYR